MKQRPILFSGAMVRALLDGSKTQTRRVMKPQPEPDDSSPGKHQWPADTFQMMVSIEDELQYFTGMAGDCCPYGTKGDQLWVRETWGNVSHSLDDDDNVIEWTPNRPATPINEMSYGRGYYRGHVIYRADGEFEWADDDGDSESRSLWHPSIHMPRAASRIQLEITGVRVERLQDISEHDAVAEGIGLTQAAIGVPMTRPDHMPMPIFMYKCLWESLNGPGSWEANPWVWVVEFKRIRP